MKSNENSYKPFLRSSSETVTACATEAIALSSDRYLLEAIPTTGLPMLAGYVVGVRVFGVSRKVGARHENKTDS